MQRLSLLATTFVSLLIAPITSWGQISFGGQPTVVSNVASPLRNQQTASIILTPRQNGDDLMARSNWNGGALIVGEVLPAHINFVESAEQYAENGKQIYRLSLEAKEARGLSVSFSRFSLPEAGRLYIYTPDKKEVLGAFTSQSTASTDCFATAPLAGNKIIIQYEAPAESPTPEIVINHLGYLFHSSVASKLRETPQRQLGLDGSSICEVNVNCPEGDAVRAQQDAIVHIYCKSGDLYSYCSGTLVNNTAEDFTPYIITAAHCGGTNSPLPKEDFMQWVFTFHYEKPSCLNNYSVTEKHFSIVGAQMEAFVPMHHGSDGLLLRLAQDIPDYYGVYYAGWDRSEEISTHHIGLHHPSGDVMKVSTSIQKPEIHQYKDKKYPGAEGAHLKVIYAPTENGYGITEGGSSGSGLFNDEGLLVGTLTGGNSYCDRNPDGFNSYGRLAYHWDKLKEQGFFMAQKLDPKGSGSAIRLAGKYRSTNVREVAPIRNLQARITTDSEGKEKTIVSWSLPEKMPDGKWMTCLWRNGEQIAELPYKAGKNTWEDTAEHTESAIDTYEIALAIQPAPNAEKITFAKRTFALRVGPQAGVRDFQSTTTNGETSLSWKKPINYQLVTQVPFSETNFTTLKKFRYSSVFVYDIRDLYLGVRFNGYDLPMLKNAGIIAMSFVPARSEKIHHYSLFIRSGVNYKKGRKKEVVVGDDTPNIKLLQEIKTPLHAKKRCMIPLQKPFVINSSEDLIVGVKVSTEIDFEKDVVAVANNSFPTALGGVASYDSFYWRTFDDSFNEQKGTPLFAVVLSDQDEKEAVEIPDNLPYGTFPAPFPTLRGYRITQNGQTLQTIEDPELTQITIKGSGKYDVIPLYDEDRLGTSETKEITSSMMSKPIVTPTQCVSTIQVKGEQLESITLYDLKGQKVLSQAIDNDATVDVSTLAHGNYIAKIKTLDSTEYIVRLMKE